MEATPSSAYNTYIAPTLHHVQETCSSCVEKANGLFSQVKERYTNFQSSCSRVVAGYAGPTAGRVVEVACKVFPEIVSFILSVGGQIVIPALFMATRAIMDMTEVFSTYKREGLERAKEKATQLVQDAGKRLLQAAVLTSFLAGGAFVVTGITTDSAVAIMRGGLFLGTAYAGRGVLTHEHTP